jgi:hypothetical protein
MKTSVKIGCLRSDSISNSFTCRLIKVLIQQTEVRGRVSKYVINGIKTAVTDVIGFLCLSLGSSTVQLHDSLRSRRACACSEASCSSQNGVRAWGVYSQRAAFCYAFFFFWQKGIHKEMFPAYRGKCLSSKAVHNWAEKFSQPRSKVTDDARLSWNGGAEVAETTVERLLHCGDRRTGKAIGQVYQCWWRICREITCFTFYIHL